MKKDSIKISFLITHYNRPYDLLQCINAIENLDALSYEIVVSDDYSSKDNLKLIEDYAIDKLILAPQNQGLAANINKGIKSCEGEYIVYCQEDFILMPDLSTYLPECLNLLHTNKVDMIRFTSNVKFNKLIHLTENVKLIPKFSFENFQTNYYQYSDHPFIVKKSFYKTYDYYLENTSGRYGETEYAIRILKSKARIGLTKKAFAMVVEGSVSVLANESGKKNKEIQIYKPIVKMARAFRLYYECLRYNSTTRGLRTYKNFRIK
ncbi:glycosyltransferase family 2 protein [Flavobacterium algicola]|uniref:glycosyltransferase family 2 protein n=1 Tax=Flavobacterium algicola TaxID=556529 RepID=UPI001EFCD387|nr:glycosyltransferase family 2 protein [Flavobacterium algicola]MCG9793882.1 glycosyltransferase [Flavobacterium algicola]